MAIWSNLMELGAPGRNRNLKPHHSACRARSVRSQQPVPLELASQSLADVAWRGDSTSQGVCGAAA